MESRPEPTAWRRLLASADVIGLYFVLALGLLSPMASNEVLPAALDHANHTAVVVEAKHALEEGQFPLRVAPFANGGLRYPLFQFYSQTPYLIAAGLYKFLPPHNPWLAIKMIYLFGLCAAGFFVYKTCGLLGCDKSISTLTGVVYMSAPYLLVNIHARGAYTETVAQFVLPALAFTTVRLARTRRPGAIVWACLPWLILGTSHLISLVLTTGFYLLCVAGLVALRRIRGRVAADLLMACVLGWGLSAFQWFPAATTSPLRLRLEDVFDYAWLTPLGALLSLTSTPPEPVGRPTAEFLNPAIGLPILVAVGGLLYLRRSLGSRAPEIWLTLALFALAAFAAWSPINFWALLPQQIKVVQFSYRLLTYTMVFGTMLFASFLIVYRRQYGAVAFLPCLIALLLAARPYLPELKRSSRSLSSIIAAPETSYSSDIYMYAGPVPASPESFRGLYERRLPLEFPDRWLRVGTPTAVARAYVDQAVGGYLLIRGEAVAPAQPVHACTTLTVTLDGVAVAAREIGDGPFEWRVPTSAFTPLFTAAAGQLSFESACGFVPREVDPPSQDARRLWIRVRELHFSSPGDRALSVADVRPHCAVTNAAVVCDIDLERATTAQLPMLFYPSLLRVSVNGHETTSTPSYDGQDILASVALGAGHSRVVGRFAGSSVGNAVSMLSVGIVAVLVGLRRRRPSA